MKDRVLAWARATDQTWWTASQVAEAVGAPEDEVRLALSQLEDCGAVYRSVAKTDSFRLTADGRDDVVLTALSAEDRAKDERGRP